ncbi:uncharacterized protein At2g24330-like isoform X1 [Cynara cardunculus var. scolymus]|uniref:uncharacterized protein At2g24330-like isoform X1 n=2 Tax=Cynara cardunculus var. scolymus TaxID=59895 RepID=UPI000D62B4C9|nr:uncharacterized protein At2g24330-like isoform X1 [Cynara cardunculus var. scolymus]XP_024960186.1 uncharacterized protein At2g24330-like isoform X1 [Cynara cardunculus var. scolymus]
MGEEDDNTDKKTKRSFFSRVWNVLFRLHADDFEKRLQYISKEEATLLARMKRRSSSWKATTRNLIIVSVFLEVIVVVYAIITRSEDLEWQMRAIQVLPIFLLPCLSSALYWALFSFTKLCDNRDQKTLESLRAERQAKIEELKERTNYYTTQQLIQKYDSDPAAKAAAASVLASKLCADSGLKVFLEEGFQFYTEDSGKSNDFEPVKPSGLRKRFTSESASKGGNFMPQFDKEMVQYGVENEVVSEVPPKKQLVVEHHDTITPVSQDGGWFARVAALLVGADPSQSYALICGHCHMHNGLVSKEDFPYITYFCPHCDALNKPRTSGENSPGTSTIGIRSPTNEGASANLIKRSSEPMKSSTLFGDGIKKEDNGRERS